MGISGCTACQVGGPEALKAYDQAFQVRRDNDTVAQAKALAEQEARRAQQAGPIPSIQTLGENRPTPGATVGGVINISV